MMRMALRTLLCMMLLTLSPLGMAGAAWADDAQDAITDIKCDIMPPGQLTEGVYNCVKAKLDDVSQGMIENIYTKVAKAVSAVMIISIALFGAKFVLMGTRQPKPEFMIMMLKFSIVAALVFGISNGKGILEFRELILDAGQGFSSFVFTGGDSFGAGSDNIFQSVDQMIYRVLGVDSLEVQDDGLGTIAMVGGLIFAGPLGAKAFANAGWVIGMLLYAFVLALYINIVALVALTFLLMLSPIVLPLMMFEYTKYIPMNWMKQIISYSFQPMIVTAFLSMMLLTINSLMGSFDQVVETSKQMAGDPNYAKAKMLWGMPEVEKPPGKNDLEANKGSGFSSFADMFSSTAAGPGAMGVSATRQIDQQIKGAASGNFKVPVTPFSPEQVAGLLNSLFVLIITIGAMLQFMRELPSWVSELAGGDRITPSLAEAQPTEEIRQNFVQDR